MSRILVSTNEKWFQDIKKKWSSFYDESAERNEGSVKAVAYKKMSINNENYFTISGYASLRGMNVDTSKANMLGRKATKLSREYGYDIDKVTDSRFGKVNSYHLDILKEVFEHIA